MSNMPDIENGKFSFRAPLKLLRQLQVESKRRGMSQAELVNLILSRELRDVKLTIEDVDWIHERMVENVKNRN